MTFDCGSDPVTIDISSGTGTKVIAADTTIDGGRLVTISGGNSVGVFSVDSGINFSVENLTIAEGHVAGVPGDGIVNAGRTNVINSTFSNNLAVGCCFGLGCCIGSSLGVGGAISNGLGGNESPTLTVTDSTFTGNNAADFGGGISSFSGSLTVTNSTFTGNNADAGGAIANGISLNGGPVVVTNSTFYANNAIGPVDVGGGIYNLTGSLTVTNSTFYLNGAVPNEGGSIQNGVDPGPGAAPALIRNTILAGSMGSDNCSGSFTDGGHNLDDGTSCGFNTANGSLNNTNPQLDPTGLRDNGGPTQTLALCQGAGIPAEGCTTASAAIGTGDQDVCAAAPVNGLDQRGFVRPGSGHTECSIGAYEAGAVPFVCIGDCNNDGAVSVDELILGVYIALGVQPVTACSAFANSEGVVDIVQLIEGVNNGLHGCGGAAGNRLNE